MLTNGFVAGSTLESEPRRAQDCREEAGGFDSRGGQRADRGQAKITGRNEKVGGLGQKVAALDQGAYEAVRALFQQS